MYVKDAISEEMMNANFDKDAEALRKGSAWLMAEYAGQAKRIDLISRYNNAVGEPSPGVVRVQEDFLNNRMEPAEVVAFVGVCEKLIAAIQVLDADGFPQH
jgi:hypothetical protein